MDSGQHIKLEGPARFAVDELGRIRMDTISLVHEVPAKEGGERRRFVEVFNGKREKILSQATDQRTWYPYLEIRPVKHNTDLRYYRYVRLYVLLMMYRPFVKGRELLDPDKFSLIDDNTVIEGRPCVVVRNADWMIWVDRERDYVPVRVCGMSQKETLHRADVSYSENKEHGWVPVSWKESYVGFYSGNSKVSAYSLNTRLSDELFDISPPVGAYVADLATHEEYIHRGSSKRPVKVGDIGVYGYDKLLNTEPSGASSFGRYTFIISAALLGLLIVLVVRLMRKRSLGP
jgi:hypothetical protein